MKTYLLLDCSYLCRRAMYSRGHLGAGDTRTGTIYGFLQDLLTLEETWGTDDFVFCFDSRHSKRKKLFPQYKQRRHTKERTEKEKEEEKQFHKQVRKLRKKILPFLGFNNILQAKGYEADDLIASVCANLKQGEEAIIVSSDEDFYQLLKQDSVCCFNPYKSTTTTQEAFEKEHKIKPADWIKVKAIAGCTSDEIPGVDGVGQKTAIRYLLGELKPDSVAYNKIVAPESQHVIYRNGKLVALPFPKTPVYTLKENEVTRKKWNRLAKKLGFPSLEVLTSGNLRPDSIRKLKRRKQNG